MVDKHTDTVSEKSEVEDGKMLKNWLIWHGMTH